MNRRITKFDSQFDSLFNDMFHGVFADSKQHTYPPADIIKTKDGNIIRMAVAGYNKKDINVSLEDWVLTISGKKQEGLTGVEYIHQGISQKSFTRHFTLEKSAEITDVSLTDGMLTVTIKQNEPKPKRIDFDIK